jgi:endo-1,4-beta-D-glucanase Y
MHPLIPRLLNQALVTALLVLAPACGGCRKGPWALWTAYSGRFIDAQGRVIDPMGNRTTSEGQAYALFFALVDNDRPRFDLILDWTTNNLAQGDLSTHLPAWLWGKDKDGKWHALDANSASDADVWLAYTLLEAGLLWKQQAYADTGHRLIAQIDAHEVADLPGFGPMLLPGPRAGFVHGNVWTVNPSYLPEFLFARLAWADPAGRWQKIASGIPRLLRQSSPKGFAMDWVSYSPGDGFFPSPEFPDSKTSPVGGYDAIRVYLWAGLMDEHDSARASILDALPGMSAWLADHDAPPEMVSDQGIANGKDGNVGFSAAVIPYLRAMPGSGKALARQSIRLHAGFDRDTGLYGKDLTYYDQNLALFATGFLDGRYRFGPNGELKVEWSRS